MEPHRRNAVNQPGVKIISDFMENNLDLMDNQMSNPPSADAGPSAEDGELNKLDAKIDDELLDRCFENMDFEAAANSAPLQEEDGISCILALANGIIMQSSCSVLNFLGYPTDMWVGRFFLDFVCSLDQHSFVCKISETLMTPTNRDIVQYKGKKRSPLYCRIRKYRGLTNTGFGIKKDDIIYMPFAMKLNFKGTTMDEKKSYLIINGTPVYSAFKVPNEPVIKPKPFVIRHGPKGNFECLDRESIPYLGYFPQDVINRSILELYHPDDLPDLVLIYKTIVSNSGVVKSRPFRILAHNGDYVTVEGEWSCYINPMSGKLEYIHVKYYAVEGPMNPNVFQVFVAHDNVETEERQRMKAQYYRDNIVRIMTEVFDKPAHVQKDQLNKRCLDLALLMENLMEPNKENDMPEELQEQDQRYCDHHTEVWDVLPHFERDCQMDSFSYTHLNYNETMHRYFKSHELETDEEVASKAYLSPGVVKLSFRKSWPYRDDSADSGGEMSDDNKSTESNTFAPIRLTELLDNKSWPYRNGSGDSGGQMSDDNKSMDSDADAPIYLKEVLLEHKSRSYRDGSGDSGGRMSDDNKSMESNTFAPIRLTEVLLDQHNEDMEKELVKKHCVSHSNSQDGGGNISSDTRKRKNEHFARCNANFLTSNAQDHAGQRGPHSSEYEPSAHKYYKATPRIPESDTALMNAPISAAGDHQNNTAHGMIPFSNTMQANNMPTNTMPANNMPTNTMAANIMPANNMPTNTMPTNTMPANTTPEYNMPTNTMAANTMPANTTPEYNIPTNTMAANTMTANAMPANNMPTNTIPANNMPTTNTMAANTMTANAMPEYNMPMNTMPLFDMLANNMPSFNMLDNNMSTNTMAANTMPEYNMPANTMPEYNMPRNTMSANTMAANSMPTNNMSTNTMPANTIPANTMPAEIMPANNMPANNMPTNIRPANTMPANNMPTSRLANRMPLMSPIQGVPTLRYMPPRNRMNHGCAPEYQAPIPYMMYPRAVDGLPFMLRPHKSFPHVRVPVTSTTTSFNNPVAQKAPELTSSNCDEVRRSNLRYIAPAKLSHITGPSCEKRARMEPQATITGVEPITSNMPLSFHRNAKAVPDLVRCHFEDPMLRQTPKNPAGSNIYNKKEVPGNFKPTWTEKEFVTERISHQFDKRNKQIAKSSNKRIIKDNSQLGQLQLDQQLAGVTAKLTLGSVSGEVAVPSNIRLQRKREYSQTSMFCEEDVPALMKETGQGKG